MELINFSWSSGGFHGTFLFTCAISKLPQWKGELKLVSLHFLGVFFNYVSTRNWTDLMEVRGPHLVEQISLSFNFYFFLLFFFLLCWYNFCAFCSCRCSLASTTQFWKNYLFYWCLMRPTIYSLNVKYFHVS